MKKIITLLKTLEKLGLNKETSSAYRLLKSAVPLEDFVPIHKYEPTRLVPEEDEDGNPIEVPIEKVEREKHIKQDQRSRDYIITEEDKKKDLDDWYSQLKNIAESIILIPFDRTDVDSNEDILYGLSSIFRVDASSYEKLKEKVYMLGSSYLKQGSLDVLKEVFPSLWADIHNILISKNLDENEVVYILYNQQTNPGRFEQFSKNPFYLAHDIGHSIFDSEDGDPEFKEILQDFLRKVSPFFKREEEDEEITATEAIETLIDDNDDNEISTLLTRFFDFQSGEADLFGDIFANTTNGTVEIDLPYTICIPAYSSNEYILSSEHQQECKEIANKTISKLKRYVNSHHDTGGFGRGPLSHLAGSVVLQDL